MSLAAVNLGRVLEALRPMLTDSVIRRSVGHEVFRRGAAYASQGRVSDIAYSRTHGQVVATVIGSAGRRYRTVAAYDAGSAQWWGDCSCPVGEDCKHVAAVLVAARESLGGSPPARASRTPDWETALADLVPSTAPSGQRAGTALGLQFEVPGTSAPSVRLRPVVMGAKGRWIRTGVSWRNLQYDYYGQRDPAHAAALRALHRAHQAADDSPAYYGYADAPVLLEEFGPALWPALRQAVDDGVTLVTTRGGPVHVADEPVSLAVDLRRDGDADLLIEPVVDLGSDVRVPAGAVRLLGSPPHGAVLLPGGPGLPSDLVPDKGLLLVPVRQVPRRAEKLLTAGSLRVPAADRGRFLTGFYPALHRTLPVRSFDGSVELPEVLPPQLCLHVDHTGGHRARLTWSVQYRTGEEVRRLPLAGENGAAPDPGRDVAA